MDLVGFVTLKRPSHLSPCTKYSNEKLGKGLQLELMALAALNQKANSMSTYAGLSKRLPCAP